jgi:hypothetical protein
MGKHLQTVDDHVTDITISTATVDIQVMRIGTKQMTLAVFRQLHGKDIFNECGNLLAPAWGWVNYDRVSWDDTKPFVFSYEGILYRDKINLETHYKLKVQAEIKQTQKATYYTEAVFVPTGKWIITPEQESRPDVWNFVGMLFNSEQGARAHLANRLISVAKLKEVPQLFIGV